MPEIRFCQHLTGFAQFVPSISDTLRWYEKHLGIQAEAEDEVHAMLYIPGTNCLVQFLQSDSKTTGANASMFLFVEGIEKVRNAILNTGWDKLTEIVDEGWCSSVFKVYDLNGFELRICEF